MQTTRCGPQQRPLLSSVALRNTGVFVPADRRGGSGEPERERDPGGLSGQRDASARSHRGATEGAAQPGNRGNHRKLPRFSSLHVESRCGGFCLFFCLAVAGSPPEPADPHLPAAAVPSHVPPGHPVPRRPAEDHAADAARDGGTTSAAPLSHWKGRS